MDFLTPEEDTTPCPRGTWFGFNRETGKPSAGLSFCDLNSCSRCVARKVFRYTQDIVGYPELIVFRTSEKPDMFKKRIQRANTGAFVATLIDKSRIYLTRPVIEQSMTALQPHEAVVTMVHYCQDYGVKQFRFVGQWQHPAYDPQFDSDLAQAPRKIVRQAFLELGYLDGVDPAMISSAMSEVKGRIETIKRRPKSRKPDRTQPAF